MKAETKVGILFLASLVVLVMFAYFIGILSPFASSYTLTVAYNYAGGIDVGSPVRVMGIKVGKVKSIQFDPNLKMPNGEEVKLRVKISVSRKAWPTIRQDSQFFINLAGVIGEKFIEISPGSLNSPMLKSGQVVRGVDPPRIDQLISQSYGLAGKIFDFVKKSEGSFTNTLHTMNRLVVNFDRVLTHMEHVSEKTDINELLQNMVQISGDMAALTKYIRTKEGQKTLSLMHELIWRLKDVDKKSVKKFFQEEGIRARVF
ncbi:MAG: MCE family protein [Bdellovibrio sp.]|nr:MAG: MCE family protein [Bdellovibrio sp.]